MEESQVKLPKKLYNRGCLTLLSLLAVLFTVHYFPQWPSIVTLAVFLMVFGHTMGIGFSFTMQQSRDDSLNKVK